VAALALVAIAWSARTFVGLPPTSTNAPELTI
jgi:hypothetical protein